MRRVTERIDCPALASRLVALARGEARCFFAIAGAPGSGKSTLAEWLMDEVEAAAPGGAAILPMDGFHYDDLYLAPRGLLPRKGAPETFDTGGFEAVLRRLAEGSHPVAVPVFDRRLEIARAGARVIPPETRLIIVEGNYLLLDHPDWAALRHVFDLTLALDVPLAALEARLLARWQTLGPVEAARKVEANDLPNARLTITESVAPDWILDDP